MTRSELNKHINNIYLILILSIFPLFIYNKYYNLGYYKFQFYIWATLIFLISTFLCSDTLHLGNVFHNIISSIHPIIRNPLHLSMVLYGLIIVISYLFSPYKKSILIGSYGWFMGLIPQLSFIIIYSILTNMKLLSRIVIFSYYISSVIVFTLGIMHGLGIDPLDLHHGLDNMQSSMFLSTIGQSSWYSSYLMTMMPLSIVPYIYYRKTSHHKASIILLLHSLLTFLSLLTQPSDGAYVSYVAILLFTLCIINDINHIKRLSYLNIGFWIIACILSIIRPIIHNSSTFIETRNISNLLTTDAIPWYGLVLSLLFLIIITYFEYSTYYINKNKKSIYTNTATKNKLIIPTITIIIIAIIGTILLITLNTKYQLYNSIPILNHSYLIFNNSWGNYRGLITINTFSILSNNSVLRWLVGYGPDSYGYISHSIPEINNSYAHTFGHDIKVLNAHNEYLNSLICYGICGLLAYINIFFQSIRASINSMLRTSSKTMPIVAICVISYMCQAIFGYQTICTTPLLFIIIGLSSIIE